MSARELITEHLDLWTGAVRKRSSSGRGSNGKVELTGVKKLRELILELAVRGKLLTQDVSDESAPALLNRIKDIEQELVKSKRIRKPKHVTSVSTEEAEFALPSSWQWVRLGAIGQIMGGGTPKSGEPSYWSGKGIPWLTPADLYGLKEKHIASGNRDISELGLAKSSAQLLPVGSVLFSSRAPIGYVAITTGELATNQGFKSCVPHIEEMNQFIYYFLKRSAPYIDASASGTTFKEVSGTKVASIPMPLPPLEEQRRIVQKVDELMALCDRMEQQTSDQLEAHETLVDTLLGTLTQSENATELADNWVRLAAHFDTLFTTEQSIDKLKQTILQLTTAGKLVNFQVAAVPLKNILSFGPRNGFSPKESPYETGYKVLKLGATTKGRLDLLESKCVDIGNSAPPHLWLKKGDILIQRGNAANHVGCNVILEEDWPNYIYPDLMMKIRVNDREAIPSFVSLYLSAPGSRQFMWERMTGTSGTMPKISKRVVEEIPIAIPSLETQQAVVQKVDELMALCDQLREHLNQASETRCQLAEAVVEKATEKINR